jgi:hypothetical protein
MIRLLEFKFVVSRVAGKVSARAQRRNAIAVQLNLGSMRALMAAAVVIKTIQLCNFQEARRAIDHAK